MKTLNDQGNLVVDRDMLPPIKWCDLGDEIPSACLIEFNDGLVIQYTPTKQQSMEDILRSMPGFGDVKDYPVGEIGVIESVRIITGGALPKLLDKIFDDAEHENK